MTALYTQSDFIEDEKGKGDPIWIRYGSLKTEVNNLRKGLFKRYSGTEKIVESMQMQILELRDEINKMKKHDYSDLEIFKKK